MKSVFILEKINYTVGKVNLCDNFAIQKVKKSDREYFRGHTWTLTERKSHSPLLEAKDSRV